MIAVAFYWHGYENYLDVIKQKHEEKKECVVNKTMSIIGQLCPNTLLHF